MKKRGIFLPANRLFERTAQEVDDFLNRLAADIDRLPLLTTISAMTAIATQKPISSPNRVLVPKKRIQIFVQFIF